MGRKTTKKAPPGYLESRTPQRKLKNAARTRKEKKTFAWAQKAKTGGVGNKVPGARRNGGGLDTSCKCRTSAGGNKAKGGDVAPRGRGTNLVDLG